MATIENFLLRFKVDGQQAITNASNAVKGLSDRVSQFGASTGQVGDAVGGLIGRLGPLGAAAGAVGLAFAGLGLRAIQLADEIGDIGDATGISAGALLNFKQSVIEAGGKIDDFSQLAFKLNQSIGEAANGNDKLQKTFKTLGVFVTDAGGNVRSTEVILRDAIARLAAIEDPATRAALAVDLFGKSAAKLDFTKLNALRDPVADADIKRLSEYQAAIDRVRNTLERKLISFFGGVALELEKASEKLRKEEERLNALGVTNRPIPGAMGRFGEPVSGLYTPEGGIGTRRLTEQEKAAIAERKRIAEMERLMAPAANAPRGRTELEKPGGFGKLSEAEQKANAKALADWQQRLADNVRQTDLQQALRSANEQQAIQLQTDAEVARAREEIFSRERLTREQKEHEFAEKELAIRSAAANKIQQVRMRASAQAYAQEEAEREANRQAIAAQEQAIGAAAMAAYQQAAAYKEVTNQLAEQYTLEEMLRYMTGAQAETQRKIAEEVRRRTEALKSLEKIENLTFEERQRREQEIRNNSEQAIQLIRTRGAEETARQQNFSLGWEDAFRKYAESSKNAADQAKTYFDTFARGFEDAFIRFVKTGKLSFKDLVNTMIAEFARLQAQKFFLQLFGDSKGQGGMLMNLFTWGKSLFGLANGGMAQGGTPYIVGERGPELFVPFSSGRVIPNNQLGMNQPQPSTTMVTYNIQAVDAASFRQMVARDPAFIYAVTEKGRASTPTRRIA